MRGRPEPWRADVRRVRTALVSGEVTLKEPRDEGANPPRGARTEREGQPARDDHQPTHSQCRRRDAGGIVE
jgi:hypothetical protein